MTVDYEYNLIKNWVRTYDYEGISKEDEKSNLFFDTELCFHGAFWDEVRKRMVASIAGVIFGFFDLVSSVLLIFCNL